MKLAKFNAPSLKDARKRIVKETKNDNRNYDFSSSTTLTLSTTSNFITSSAFTSPIFNTSIGRSRPP